MIVIIYYLFRSSGESLTSRQSAKNDLVHTLKKNTGAINFTYSIWFFINEWTATSVKDILQRGHTETSSATQLWYPKVYLGNKENDICVDISYLDEISSNPNTHTCQISNVPLQKWVNLIISVYGRSIDLYIDGKLVRTCVMPNTVYMGDSNPPPSDNITITPNGGFEGETAQIMYWGNATNPSEAADIYRKGYGGSLLGNLINKYRFQFSFIKDGREVGSVQI